MSQLSIIILLSSTLIAGGVSHATEVKPEDWKKYYEDSQRCLVQEPDQRASPKATEQAAPRNEGDCREVAGNLRYIAHSLFITDRGGEAESYYKRSLAVYEKDLGPDHSEVVKTLDGLAGLYLSQERYAQAEPLYKRALSIREKTRQDTLQNLANLAQTYRKMHDNGQSAFYYERLLAYYEKPDPLGLEQIRCGCREHGGSA